MPPKKNGKANGNGSGDYARVVDGYLEIRMKVTAGRPSSTGKSLVIATTGGFSEIEGGAKLNLTAITPRK